MKKVIIESPYAGDTEKNIKYARMCLKHSLDKGESPLASHLLYTQKDVLDDNVLEDRKKGINAGLAWIECCDLHVIYIDLGISDGMMQAMDKSSKLGIKVEFREILKNFKDCEKLF